MSGSLDALTMPLIVGGRTIRNRIIFGSIRTNFASDQCFSSRHAAFYRARARGGVSLVVLEESLVHPSDWPYERAIFGYQERVVPGYRRLADAIHAEGALALAQLNHSGGQGSSANTQLPLWAPSRVPEVNTNEVPKSMELEDIAALVAGFANAARFAQEGGLDGVELNVGQHSILRQFLSGLTNHRQDAYGSNLEGRLRFLLETIAAVRGALGPPAILGIKLSVDELAPWAGLRPEDSVQIARQLASTGQINYLTVTRGSIYTVYATRPSMHTLSGFNALLAEQVKRAVQVPVFVQGSLVDVEQAAAIVRNGQADGVEMTRALIADPDLPAQLSAGRVHEIKSCILCNQQCIVDNAANSPLTCVHNITAGFEEEQEAKPLDRVSRPRRVLVVGGGPAGMAAACVAAERGHQVMLWEKSDCLGGTVRLAARALGRERLTGAVDYLERRTLSLRVALHLGEAVRAEQVAELEPDVIIVATGSRIRPFELPGADALPVLSPRDVLNGSPCGDRVVIIDEEGGWHAVGAAEYLTAQGKAVTIVARDMFVSPKLIDTQDLSPWYQRAFARGVNLVPQSEAQRFEDRQLWVVDRFTREPRLLGSFDTVVAARPELPNEELYHALRSTGVRLNRVGDCVAPRSIYQAVLEGTRAGEEL